MKSLDREQPDVVVVEEMRHRPGMGDIGQGAGDDDPVETRQHTGDLVLVARHKRIHLGSLLTPEPTDNDRRSGFLVPAMPG